MEPSGKSLGTQLIGRAFQLLALFRDERSEWTLQEMVAASGLKKSTVFRILTALEREGMMQRYDTGRYRLGVHAIVLGARAVRTNPLRQLARPYLSQLSQQTGETTTLELLRVVGQGQPISVVVDEVLGPYFLGVIQYSGMQFPAHATATGKALLAHQPQALMQRYLAAPLVSCTDRTLTAPHAIRDALELVRRQGFATCIDELEIGIIAAAAPIFDRHGQVQAALGMSGPGSRISAEALMAIGLDVAQMAAALSAKSGHAA